MKTLFDYTLVCRRDDNGSFVAHLPAIAGCHALGPTPEEAQAHGGRHADPLESPGPPGSNHGNRNACKVDDARHWRKKRLPPTRATRGADHHLVDLEPVRNFGHGTGDRTGRGHHLVSD